MHRQITALKQKAAKIQVAESFFKTALTFAQLFLHINLTLIFTNFGCILGKCAKICTCENMLQ